MVKNKGWRSVFGLGVGLIAVSAGAFRVWQMSAAEPFSDAVFERGERTTLGDRASAQVHGPFPRVAEGREGRRYAVDFEIAAQEDSQAQAQNLAGTVRLSLHQAGAAPGGFRWVGVIDEVTTAVDSEVSAATAEQTVREFALSFTFVVSGRGEALQIGFPPDAPPKGQQFARSLVAALQFVHSESDASAWTAKEPSALGPCTAHYQRTGQGRYTKTKADCSLVSVASVAELGVKTAVTSSAEYELAERVVQRMSSTETLSFQYQPGSSTSVTTTLGISASGSVATTNPHPASGTWHLGSVFAPKQEARPLSAEEVLAGKRALLDGGHFVELSAELDAAIAAEDGEARLRSFSRLSALFELEPESINEAAALLRTDIAASKAEAIVAALADSKSAAAQSEMNSLLKDPHVDREVKDNVVVHLGLHQAPSLETIDTLEDVALYNDDAHMRSQAKLALGGAARHAAGNEETKAEGQRTTEWLNASYDKALTAEERGVLMGAIGNAGAASSLTAIDAALKGPDAQLRADAVFSLRFVPGPQAEQLIAQTMLTDAEATVRRAAVETFGYRELSPVLEQAALSVYKADTASFVRHGVISFLCAKAPKVGAPGAEALKLATADEDEAVRKNAAGALALLAL